MPEDSSSSEAIPSLTIRLATEADRPRVIALVNSAFAIESFLDGTRTDEERLASLMEKGEILVGQDDAGQLLCSIYIELRGKRGYLGMLAVDPAHQGRGLARRLVEAAEDHFRLQGCETAEMTVLSLRPELPPIYRRFGYIETGIEEFKPSRPLRDGLACHGIPMSKIL